MTSAATGFAWGERLPALAAERVELRWMTSEDVPALLAIFGDSEVMRYWSSPPLTDLHAAAVLLDEIHESFRSGQLFQWGIASRDERCIVGTCTLFRLDATHRHAEVGFALGRNAWGRGLASEALATVIGFAFDTLGLHRLEADVDPRNARSLRVLERQGFQREGYLRECYHVGGEVQDAVYLGLLAREWRRPAKREMPATALIEILETLEDAGIAVWLDGGWGVDALLGRQTRAHRDADVILGVSDVPRLTEILGSKGFTIARGAVPHAFVLADGFGLELDIHAVTWDSAGNGVHRMENGEPWVLPAEGFTGRGSVGVRRVRCLSPATQVLCHAQGYAPTETDLRDMALLRDRFGVDLPALLRQASP